MHFPIFVTLLLLLPCILCYWRSEENLLEVLEEDTTKREQLLQKSNRHLAAIGKSLRKVASNNIYLREATEISKQLWWTIQYLKIVIVEWNNFLDYFYTWPNVAHAVRAKVLSKFRGIYADYLTEDNLYKLINLVRNLLKSQTITQRKSLSVKNLHEQQTLNKVYKFKQSLKKFMEDASFIQPANTFVNKEVYSKLCRGETEVNYSSLFVKCRYFHYNNPYLIIAPFKMEELQNEPPVRFFHEVLTDSEIETIKQMALDKKMKISQGKETFYRVAKIAWLARDSLKSVSQRIALMTNLDMNSAEGLQVGVYGIAGHYEPHYDASLNHGDETSSRIATVLFYLNDNFQGGATVFPGINLSVFPKKGGAVVWYNIRSDFEVDGRSLHASCPLHSGVKWVLNAWIRHTRQEFRQPCDSIQTDTFTLGKPYSAEL